MNSNINQIDNKKLLEVKMEKSNNINIDNNKISGSDDSSDEILSGNDMSENNEKYRSGRWHPSEHFRFIKGCLLHGNNWKKVKECVKTRSSAQIRSHAQKYIIKLCKKFNIQDNKQLKNFKNIKKKFNTDMIIAGNYDILDLKSDNGDMSGLNMERIEEMILGIFKSNSGINKKHVPVNVDSLNLGVDCIESSNSIIEDKKNKVFETVKGPRFSKRKYGKVGQNVNIAANMNFNINNQLGNQFGLNEDQFQSLLNNYSNLFGNNMNNLMMYDQNFQFMNMPQKVDTNNKLNSSNDQNINLLNYLLMGTANSNLNEDLLNPVIKGNMNLQFKNQEDGINTGINFNTNKNINFNGLNNLSPYNNFGFAGLNELNSMVNNLNNMNNSVCDVTTNPIESNLLNEMLLGMITGNSNGSLNENQLLQLLNETSTKKGIFNNNEIPNSIKTKTSEENQTSNNFKQVSDDFDKIGDIGKLQSLQQISDVLKMISGNNEISPNLRTLNDAVNTNVNKGKSNTNDNTNAGNTMKSNSKEKIAPEAIDNTNSVKNNSNNLINPSKLNSENILPDDLSMNMLLNLFNSNNNSNLFQLFDLQQGNNKKEHDLSQSDSKNEEKSDFHKNPQMTFHSSNPGLPSLEQNMNIQNFNNLLNEPLFGLMNQFLFQQNPNFLQNTNTKTGLDNNIFLNNYGGLDFCNMDSSLLNLNQNTNQNKNNNPNISTNNNFNQNE